MATLLTCLVDFHAYAPLLSSHLRTVVVSKLNKYKLLPWFFKAISIVGLGLIPYSIVSTCCESVQKLPTQKCSKYKHMETCFHLHCKFLSTSFCLILLLSHFSQVVVVDLQCLYHISPILFMCFHPWEHVWPHHNINLMCNIHSISKLLTFHFNTVNQSIQS